jgi:hypothetical protein
MGERNRFIHLMVSRSVKKPLADVLKRELGLDIIPFF